MSETPDFSATLNLPKTDFAMRANLPQREPDWVKRWLECDVYGQLRAKRQAEGAEKFILHLGPPYANGHMHLGHALTYVLKDFIVRHKFMSGLDSPYAPGWDCHGLPIEWKVEQDLRAAGKTKHDVSKADLRARCRAYAAGWIEVQKAEWQRFGVLADWERPYKTMDFANEAGIVRELGKLVCKGLVTKGLRSTLWSWAEETALAEAEVEYAEKASTAVYVAFEVVRNQEPGTGNQEPGTRNRESGIGNREVGEYLVIWTTTPWTLPANRAVAVKGEEEYVPLRVSGKVFWVSRTLVGDFANVIRDSHGVRAEDVTRAAADPSCLTGVQMVDRGWEYRHPLYGSVQKVVDGFHVTTDSGTGLVHIAPAHGAEDFIIGKENALDLRCPVDGAGKYEPWVAPLPLTGETLAGDLIWPAQKKILAELEKAGLLLKAEDIKHSYPVSWRSKEKLIQRTTEQWFVSLDKPVGGLVREKPEVEATVREASLDRIYGRGGVKGVQWVPGYGMNRIGSMIEGRPDWCISRQRVWGVPITILTHKATGEMVADEAVWEHIAGLVAREGIDAWDNRLVPERRGELFPDGWLAARGVSVEDFVPATDILDVWFDSGTTHAHVLRADAQEPGQRFYRNDGKRPADLYQEGSDQHRGWFHSSLLTSVAVYGDAPYESVVTSGFVVDGEGRKFSKSLGNGVEPRELLQKYGMDIIRLWVGSSDYSEDIRYSPQIMEAAAEGYRKFRNTFRWLLGNLNGFDPAADRVAYADLPELERYMLHRLRAVSAEVLGHYAAYQFHKGYRVLHEFCTLELSNFYFDVRKDVLYCDAARSVVRRGCQTVLEHIFGVLATHLAPLMPFTTDEAWRSRFGDVACVHLETYWPVEAGWARDAVFGERWEALLLHRVTGNGLIEKERAAGRVGANLEVDLTLVRGAAALSAQDEPLLRELLGVSSFRFGSQPDVHKHDGEKCPRCWRYYGQLQESGVCLRCDEAMKAD